MKHLKKFETSTAYNAATLDLPNVSLIEENMSVYYNPYVLETMVVAKYNITDTSYPTTLRTSYEQNIFKSMEIDGVMLDELVTEYTFDTVGEHTVKYELYDETKLGNIAPVFYNSNLVECVIPDSVTSIGNNVFMNCINLISIDIPDGVTSIGNNAFTQCGSLTSIDIPDGVTSIGESVFYNCGNLTSCTIGSGVTSIGDSAFYNCGLTSFTIGSGVTSIGANAFRYCNFTSINIPINVTSIGDSAFQSCRSLTSIMCNAITPPTLGVQVFDDNSFVMKIYVPTASVEAYKAATNWSEYADKIQAIQSE